MEKKVSVIIPFYNGVDWLCEAVQSALDQTYKNLEIIVVNDGSPEDVSHFLEKYGDKIVYRYKENGGPASARNLALELATGDYIAFLDSDDLWLPEKTEKQLAFMEKTGVMWSHTGYYNWYPETDILIEKNNSWDYGYVYSMSFVSLRIQTPALIVNTQCFKEHELSFPNYRYGQDTALFSMIAKYYPLGLLKERLVKIRQRGTNADLRGTVRLPFKALKYKSVKNDKNLSFLIKIIYWIYYVENNTLDWLNSKLKLSDKSKENISRILWFFPFVLERLYKLGHYFVFKILTKKEMKYVG